MFIKIHLSLQFMINIEITNSIQHCIIFTNDTHLFHKEFINGFFFGGQYVNVSTDQFFYYHYKLVQIVDCQPTTLEACQQSNYAKNCISFDLGPKNPYNLSNHEFVFRKPWFMGLPLIQGQNMYNLMASHANGRLSTIHLLATHAKWPHLRSLPQRWNYHCHLHQLVLFQLGHQRM